MVSSLKHLQSSYLVWEEHHSPQLLACWFFIFLSPSGRVREQPCRCHRPTLSSVLPNAFCPPSRITQDELNLLNPLKSAWFGILFHRHPCVFCYFLCVRCFPWSLVLPLAAHFQHLLKHRSAGFLFPSESSATSLEGYVFPVQVHLWGLC